MGRPNRTLCLTAAVAGVLLLAVAVAPAAAHAADPSTPLAIGNPFGWLKDQAIGGLQWGIKEAGGFVQNLLGGIADALIPDWLAKEALHVIAWLVAVPNYAAPGRGSGGYAFGGVNDLRAVLTWVGITLVPLTLTVSAGRTALGFGQDHPFAPFTRTLGAIALVLLYPFLWSQLAALANQLSRIVLSIPAVQTGLNKQFEFMVGAGALKGVPMLGAVMLLVASVLLIALLVLKLIILVIGAMLYATGVLMPGIAGSDRGQAVAQAWLTATVGLLAIPVLWTIVFAVGALLMNDADTAANAVAGSGKLKGLIGGLMLAVGSIAATAVAIKLTKLVAGTVMGQLGGVLASAAPSRGAPSNAGAQPGGGPGGAAAKISAFGSRLGGALRQTAGQNLPGRARTGALAALGGAGALAGGGLLGTAAAGARRAGAATAHNARRVAHRSPAGAVASRMAQSAKTGWQNPDAAPRWRPSTTANNKRQPTAPSANGNTPPAADRAASRPNAAAPGRPSSPPPPPTGREPRDPAGVAGPTAPTTQPPRTSPPTHKPRPPKSPPRQTKDKG